MLFRSASTIPMGFLAMVLIVIVLFNALKQPIIIWLVVPLALIGVVFGLVTTQIPLEFMGILGLLSLSGLLIKNAIVLVDQMDMEIRQGKPAYNAIIDSANSRVRPVMMLMQNRVPYKISGGTSFFARAEIKDIMAYLRVLAYAGGSWRDQGDPVGATVAGAR